MYIYRYVCVSVCFLTAPSVQLTDHHHDGGTGGQGSQTISLWMLTPVWHNLQVCCLDYFFLTIALGVSAQPEWQTECQHCIYSQFC